MVKRLMRVGSSSGAGKQGESVKKSGRGPVNGPSFEAAERFSILKRRNEFRRWERRQRKRPVSLVPIQGITGALNSEACTSVRA
jgi:hypothetical protein